MRIVVTGAAGRLAALAVPSLLRAGHAPILLDRAAGEAGGVPIIAAALEEQAALLPHFTGADAILHLGGASIEGPYEGIRAGNLDGAFNVYECARRAGVGRVVYASSHHVVGYYPPGEALDADAVPRPDTVYAASKLFGEAIARLYWDKYGIESAVLRIGSVQPRPKEPRMLATWMSPRDFTGLVERLLTAPSLGFRTLYAISNNAAAWWPVPEVDEWTPEDRAEAASELSSDDDTEAFQGGFFTRLHPHDLQPLYDLWAKEAAAARGP